jgi:hypothetical protein
MKNEDYSILFHPRAEEEFLEAIAWYETQLTGLGESFSKQVDNVLQKISSHPLLYQQKIGKRREAQLYKFPYLIVFKVKPRSKQIYVLAVFHNSRLPSKKARK